MESTLLRAAKSIPTVVLTGPRRSGKTTLLRRLFPRAAYVLPEDPDVQSRSRSDPRAFLEELRPPVLFDEIQLCPICWLPCEPSSTGIRGATANGFSPDRKRRL